MSLQYQDFLLEEFRKRRGRNAKYSLRAFARDVGMPASKLSQNLRGLCGISVAKAQTIAARLDMRDEQRALFLALVESRHARSRVARRLAKDQLERLQRGTVGRLQPADFSLVRDWYHMAILEMTELRAFKPEVAWLSRKLGVPANLIGPALERLQALGLLSVQDGAWKQSRADLDLPVDAEVLVVNRYHKQILERAVTALDHSAVERCAYSAQTFAFDRARLAKVREVLEECQRKIASLAGEGTKDSVYVLGMQLFPVAETSA